MSPVTNVEPSVRDGLIDFGDPKEERAMELTAEQIRKEFLSIIAKLAGKKIADLKDSDKFREDLGFDSLKSLEAISRISEIYDFVPNLDEIMDIQNIGDVIKYLEKRLLQK